jgi:hypothetical protein
MNEMPRSGRWQQFMAFHQGFLARPWQALILSLLAGLAGIAMWLDWTGHSEARQYWRVEQIITATLWWSLGAYCASVAVRGFIEWRDRGQSGGDRQL